jgi:hypothetical protein
VILLMRREDAGRPVGRIVVRFVLAKTLASAT